MKEIIELGVYVAIGIPLGLVLGVCFIYVFNRMPAKWLCDYGQEPGPELTDKGIKRLRTYPSLFYLQGFFIAMWIAVFAVNRQPFSYSLTFMVILWLLLMISVADAKYTIIPDEFLIFLLLMAGALVPFGSSIKSIFTGAATGTVIMLVTALLGYFISKKESLGFGDVKLLMVIGALTGVKGCIFVMVTASIVSGLWFSVAILRKKAKPRDMLPLGPFLCGAAMLYLLFFTGTDGEQIIF